LDAALNRISISASSKGGTD
jgi:hypothetical protein